VISDVSSWAKIIGEISIDNKDNLKKLRIILHTPECEKLIYI